MDHVHVKLLEGKLPSHDSFGLVFFFTDHTLTHPLDRGALVAYLAA